MELPKKKNIRKKKNINSEEMTTMEETETETETERTWMQVPNSVMVEILPKLPAKSLLRFRRVCKYWFKLIKDPYFVKMHLNNVNATNNPSVLITKCKSERCLVFGSVNSFDDKGPVYMKVPESFTSNRWYIENLGSCNGLVCICPSEFNIKSFHDKIFIWNPCTGEYKRIWRENSVTRGPIENLTVSYGFGYDSSIDDYKLIRLVRTFNDKRASLVEVYTVGTNSSKKLPSSGFYLTSNICGLFVNGDLYWIASVTSHMIIVAFDVVKEEFRQIAMPQTNYDTPYYSRDLGKIKGCLCVLYGPSISKSAEVWVMKHNVDDMKREYSWDLLYTISWESEQSKLISHLKPLSFCKNGEIAMLTHNLETILYNPKDNQVKFLCGFSNFITADTYIESLVSIKGGTYIGGTSSITTDKPKRKLKRPLRFQDEYK